MGFPGGAVLLDRSGRPRPLAGNPAPGGTAPDEISPNGDGNYPEGIRVYSPSCALSQRQSIQNRPI